MINKNQRTLIVGNLKEIERSKLTLEKVDTLKLNYKEINASLKINNLEVSYYDRIIVLFEITSTKFFPILIKELYYLLKLNGLLELELIDNRKRNIFIFKMYCNTFLKGHFHLSSINKDNKIELTKILDNMYNPDGVQKWTFGIVTAGQKDNTVSKQIENIYNQGIKDVQILIIGKYFGKYIDNEEVSVINFDSKYPNITKKKNIIISKAKFDNIFIMHDRIFLSDDWFENIKLYGNMWDQLGITIKHKNIRAGDYLSYKTNIMERFDKKSFSHAFLLDYNDWDPYCFTNGGYHIFKKSPLEYFRQSFDEFLDYPSFEDTLFCNNLQNNGMILRFSKNVRAKSDSYHTIHYKLAYNPNDFQLDIKTKVLFTLKKYIPKSLISKIKKSFIDNKRWLNK